MNLGLFAMAACFLVTIAMLTWEIVVLRRERDEARRGMTEWYTEAWSQRRQRERAALGFPPDVPEYLFPPIIDHETVMRRILPRDQ